MPIPTYDQLIDPLLRFLAANPDGATVGRSQEALLAGMGLTDEERTRKLPKKKLLVYKHRIFWAQHRLKSAGLSTSPVRGTWHTTEAGLALSRRFGTLPHEVVELIAKLRWPDETWVDAAPPAPPSVAHVEDGRSVPTYVWFIEPLLRHLAAHPEGVRIADAHEELATGAGLNDELRALRLPSGRQEVYKNRILWAQHRLKRAGLSMSPNRGRWQITDAGAALAANPRLSSDQIERVADGEGSPLPEEDEGSLPLAPPAHVVPPAREPGPVTLSGLDHVTELRGSVRRAPTSAATPWTVDDLGPVPQFELEFGGAADPELLRSGSPVPAAEATARTTEARTSTPAQLGRIEDPGHRQVVAHLVAHGSIAEPEVAAMLGSAGKARKFARALDDLVLMIAPIRVRIDSVEGVKRYVRENG